MTSLTLLTTDYLESTEDNMCYDKNGVMNLLCDLVKDAKNDNQYAKFEAEYYKEAIDELKSMSLYEWWLRWNDPKGFGATMVYRKSILDGVLNGIADFNTKAVPRYDGDLQKITGCFVPVTAGLLDDLGVILKLEKPIKDKLTTDYYTIDYYKDAIKEYFNIPDDFLLSLHNNNELKISYANNILNSTKKYSIVIKETLSRIVTIEAPNELDAVGIAKEMYHNKEIVLDYNDFDDLDIYRK